jgi:hypothetical protein
MVPENGKSTFLRNVEKLLFIRRFGGKETY